jgi:hypothetical protein
MNSHAGGSLSCGRALPRIRTLPILPVGYNRASCPPPGVDLLGLPLHRAKPGLGVSLIGVSSGCLLVQGRWAGKVWALPQVPCCWLTTNA